MALPNRSNSMLIGIQAVIFDMDGVILNSMPTHIEAWHQAWRELGFHVDHEEIASMAGMPPEETVRAVCSSQGRSYHPELIDLVTQVKSRIRKGMAPDRPFAGISSCIQFLDEKNVPMAVVSGSRRANVQAKMEQFFPNLFSVVIGHEDTARGKPAPDPFLLALERWRQKKFFISPERCLVIEDGIAGIIGAKNAGMRTIALATTLSVSQLTGEADEIAADHAGLLDLLRKQVYSL